MKTPSVRWCHEMYGVSFVQFFGWYINQTYYRFGLLPGDSPFAYLEDVCPEEIQLTVRKAYLADSEYQIIERLIKEENPKDSITSLSDELLTVYQNFINGDVEKYNKLVRETRHLKREISAMMENFTRSEFGFKKIGEGWVNETLLYNIIKSIFPGQTVIRHFRPDWLERLELDIYLPDLKIALEYQGQQHFTAVEAWGGEKALVEVQERDRRKARLCKNNNIRLILIDFTEPLTENYIKQVIFQRET
jgi:hypothetical protein